MKQAAKTFLYGKEDVKLSETLRDHLESRLDEVNLQDDFYTYFNDCKSFGIINNDEGQLKDLARYEFDDEILARSVCMAIKTWYGMCYNDRMLILNKFYNYCRQSKLITLVFIQSDYPLAFCNFLLTAFQIKINCRSYI